MGGVNLSVHPLFFLFGLYYSLTGKIFVFLTYTFSALAHELGHSLVANKQGVKLNKIVLMPFGALAKGDIEGLKIIDQLKIAVAGPIINIIIAVIFVATWWAFPETYAFTDLAVEANLSLAIINFLPVYPLDGGRIIWALFSVKYGEKRGEQLSKIISLIFAILLFLVFIWSIFFGLNLSFLFFSIFVLISAFGKNKNNRYVRLYSQLNQKNLKAGMPYKRFAIDGNATLKSLLKMLDYNAVNEAVIYENGEKIGVLDEKRIKNLLENASLYRKLKDFV